MKITENVTVFKCDFCTKKLYRRHAMVKHEDQCLNNPKNHKACFDCIFLDKVKTDVYWMVGSPEYVENSKQASVFKCTKLDKLMFPYSIERRKLHEKYDTYSDQEPMPSICESQEKEKLLSIFVDF